MPLFTIRHLTTHNGVSPSPGELYSQAAMAEGSGSSLAYSW